MPKKNSHTGLKVLGLAAAAAAAAGAYYFYGKDGTKNRKKLAAWSVKAKGEVMEKLENLKDITESTYMDVVDQVMKQYKMAKKVAPAELDKFTKELKSHWKGIKAEVEKATK